MSPENPPVGPGGAAAGDVEAGFRPPVRLSGLGIVLREWTDDDVPVMAELFDDPQIARWTPLRSAFDLRAAREYLAAARQERTAGRRLQLAITGDGRRARGEILLMRTGPDAEEAELGYGVGAGHRRQGLAARAVRLMTAYAYDVLAMRRITLRIEADNAASAAVARACGFHRTEAAPVILAECPSGLLTWCHRPEPATTA